MGFPPRGLLRRRLLVGATGRPGEPLPLPPRAGGAGQFLCLEQHIFIRFSWHTGVFWVGLQVYGLFGLALRPQGAQKLLEAWSYAQKSHSLTSISVWDRFPKVLGGIFTAAWLEDMPMQMKPVGLASHPSPELCIGSLARSTQTAARTPNLQAPLATHLGPS